MAKKKNILAQPLTREERIAARAKAQKQQKLYMILGGVAALGIAVVVYLNLQPNKAPIFVGVCRTFAELQLAYPQTLQVTSAAQFDRATRLYYTYTDPFGEQHSNLMECKFYFDPTTHQLSLESVRVNRDLIDQAKVDAFNQTIGIVIASKPDVILPPSLPDYDLVDLRHDGDD